MSNVKPLNWKHEPGIGYHVMRRDDGGMHYVFTDLSEATVAHWLNFANEHLLDADRLTRNLYDLRQVDKIAEKVIQAAIEANSDPSARKIRIAVVVANDTVADGIRKVASLADTNFSADIHIYTSVEKAEAWLAKPLDQFA
jgi:hypothetical protein